MVQKRANPVDSRSLLTVRELAEYLRFSEAQIYRMANAGLVPACRVGKSWRFSREKIEEWISRESDAGFRRSPGAKP